MKHLQLEHQFVKHVPHKLEGGVLYISMNCCTAIHLCCCGCGREVVTPFSPTDWKMTFDGDAISLSPSIGNWNLPCRSHYFIHQNCVVAAPAWSDDMVNESYRRDKDGKAKYYRNDNSASLPEPTAAHAGEKPSLWARLSGWFKR